MDPAPLTGPGAVLVLAALISVALAGIGLTGPRRGIAQWSFAVGMTGLAVEVAATWVLLTGTEMPDSRLWWLRVRQIAALLLLIPWGLFVASLVAAGNRWALGLRAAVAGGSAGATAAAIAVAVLPAFKISEIPGPFYAAQLDQVGLYAVTFELLGTVGILGGLDLCLRASGRESRWRIKYLVLGLGGVFLVRFFFLSQLLLFHVMLGATLTAQAATLIVGNVTIAISVFRDRLLAVDLTVSRRLVYRSVLVGTLGLYLLTVGTLGWLLNSLGIAQELLWGSLVVFVSALALAAVLLSENIRWRIKRFIGLHFYRSKYDYREQWIDYTKRLSSLLSVDELARRALSAVTEAAGAAKGALYLVDARDRKYHLAGAIEIDQAPPTLDGGAPLLDRLRDCADPIAIEAPVRRRGSAPGAPPPRSSGKAPRARSPRCPGRPAP